MEEMLNRYTTFTAAITLSTDEPNELTHTQGTKKIVLLA